MRATAVYFTLVWAMTTSTSSQATGDERLSAFGPGEQTLYKISYLGVTAGTAQFTVGSEMTYEGQPVWPIVALGQSSSVGALYPVKNKFVSYWNHAWQRSIGSDLFAEENHKRRRQQIQYTGTTARVKNQKAGEQEETKLYDVPETATDLAAVTFALRNQPMTPGAEYEVPVFTGSRHFLLKAHVEGVESLETSLGIRDAFRVKIRAPMGSKQKAQRDFWMFFSTDEARLPLRMEAELPVGRIVAELTNFKPGRRFAMVNRWTKESGS